MQGREQKGLDRPVPDQFDHALLEFNFTHVGEIAEKQDVALAVLQVFEGYGLAAHTRPRGQDGVNDRDEITQQEQRGRDQ